ncbi:MAG: hypothetical protein J7639_28860 [Paenibacillaceae bacterium]|nr:hypothetical protein [Paenibacillaceae bacterium]
MAILSTLGIGNIQEQQNQLRQAADKYCSALELAGNVPFPVSCEAYMGLARIYYQWNDLGEGMKYGRQAVRFAEMIHPSDRSIAAKVVLAQMNIACGEESVASVLLDEAFQSARQHSYPHQFPPIAEAQVRIRIRQGRLKDAMQLAQTYCLPFSMARIHLAAGNSAEALAVLTPVRNQAEERGHEDTRIQTLVLQAIAEQSVQVLADAIATAEQGGFIRIFVDEGDLIVGLLRELSARGLKSNFFNKVLAATKSDGALNEKRGADLIEPLSERELEILRLIALGLSNQEIAERLFLALSTVKGHNQNIFGKLEVGRRTEAVARARNLGLL